MPDFHSKPSTDASSKSASNKSVASGMRHLAFFALCLSMPYMMNATALMQRM